MAKLNVSDKLKKNASIAKKRGSDKPTLDGNQELVDKVAKMKKEVEDVQAAYDQCERQLIEKAYPLYDDSRNGNFSNSIFTEGKDTNGLMVVFSDKYSVLPVEMENQLRKEDPKYDDHFVEVRDLKVKRDAGKTISDELIEKLMKAVGEDEFFKIFEIKQSIGCQKGMAERFHELPKSVQDILEQAKPSVRNVTEDGKVC